MDNQTASLPLIAAYKFGKTVGLEREVEEIRNMTIQWDSVYTSSLRRGYIIELFEKSNVYEDFKKAYWPFGNSRSGNAKHRRYLKIKAQYDQFLSGHGHTPASGKSNDESVDSSSLTEIPDQDDATEFALEGHLRDYLVKNLDKVEKGLRLHVDGDREGVEFPVENGRIDILAVDSNGIFVVIELKLSQGRNKALGQLLYYMGWVDKNLKGQGQCRGYVIASEISEELAIAVSRAPGVSLAKYRMTFAIESISGKITNAVST